MVELIVVIVILGILLAIAIPALTGYIAKAQDKQYIMDARDAIVAVRTVLDEAYAKGELTSSPAHPNISDYVQNGESGSATKCFLGLQIAHHSQGPLDAIYERAAAALMGKVYPAAFPNPGTWLFYLVGSNSSTALNADGFAYFFFPDDDSPGSPLIVVTYRMQRIDGITTPDDFLDALPASDYYSAEADYEVYHLVIQ